MTGLPALTVTLDDGTGTFPYDISIYVRLSDPIQITRGRADELAQIQPSTLTITLENDGRFTAGSGTYGIAIDRKIRVAETVGGTTSVRFTGGITTLPVNWPDGSDIYALAKITAVDILTPLARRRLKAMSAMDLLSDSPYSLYPLSEASGSTSAGDISGHGRAALVPAGTGTTPVFGTSGITNPSFAFSGTPPLPDGQTACTFAGGQYLTGSYVAAGSAAGFFLAVAPTGTPAGVEILASWKSAADSTWFALVRTNTTVAVVVNGTNIISPITLFTDDTFHAIEITVSGTTWTLYIDGVSVGTGVGPTLVAGTSYTFTLGGANIATLPAVLFLPYIAAGFNGSVFNAASFTTTPSAARALAHAHGSLDGFILDHSDTRMSRILGYLGVTTTALETGLQARAVAPQQTNGQAALDALNAPATSEGGLFFIRGDGVPVLQNREHRALKTAADWSITNEDIDPGTQATEDMQLVFNSVTAKATFTGAEQLAENAASLAAHDQYPTSLDLIAVFDVEALDRANWIANTSAEPQPRLASVTVDLITQLQAFQQAAISREISDRLEITSLPAQMPGGPTADLLIEGWTETIGLTAWDITFNTSNVAAAAAWVLGDATYGVLGSTTRLHF